MSPSNTARPASGLTSFYSGTHPRDIWGQALEGFRNVMDQQMWRNRHKTAWTEECIADLLPRFTAKAEQIERLFDTILTTKSEVQAIEILADAANYCMMMADLLERDLAKSYGKYLESPTQE